MFILMQSTVNDEGVIDPKKIDRERQELLAGTNGLKRISSLCVRFLSCENSSLMLS